MDKIKQLVEYIEGILKSLGKEVQVSYREDYISQYIKIDIRHNDIGYRISVHRQYLETADIEKLALMCVMDWLQSVKVKGCKGEKWIK